MTHNTDPSAGSTTARRAALWTGLTTVVVYLAGAAASGALSPAARRPLLDGLAPPSPYRWVNPPPALAGQNKPPAAGSFELPMRAKGSQLGAFSTSDGQYNVIFAENAFAPSRGQRTVVVDVTPLDPATMGSVPAGLLPAGNAYRLQARYAPSNRPIQAFAGEVSVTLVYPLPGLPLSAAHTLVYSRDGTAWVEVDTSDAPGSHTATGRLPGPGYLLVTVPPAPAAPGATGSRLRWVLALLLLGVVIAAVLYRRRRASAPRRPPPQATPAQPRPRPVRPPARRVTGHGDTQPAKPGRQRPRPRKKRRR
jgi:hypothetical protein